MNLNGVEQSLIAVKHSCNKVVYSTLYWVILNLCDRGLTFLSFTENQGHRRFLLFFICLSSFTNDLPCNSTLLDAREGENKHDLVHITGFRIVFVLHRLKAV